MSNYTYLAATLPMMTFGDPPPMASAEFRRTCEGIMPPADLAVLDAVLAGAAVPGHAFATGWHDRETQLRNAVARARAAHLATDARAFLKDHGGWDMSVAKAVTDAFAKPNPLEREMELDRCRWHVAEDLARSEPFGLAAVLSFAVRLRMAERWAALKDEAGARRVEELVDTRIGTTNGPAESDGLKR